MISGDDFVRAMKKIGYERDHITGSHMILLHPQDAGFRSRAIPSSGAASFEA